VNQETQQEGKETAFHQHPAFAAPRDPSSSGDGKNNTENEVSNQSPLSWADARDRLRCKLEQWKEEGSNI